MSDESGWVEGDSCFALWEDGKYYSACIIGMTTEGSYLVQYTEYQHVAELTGKDLLRFDPDDNTTDPEYIHEEQEATSQNPDIQWKEEDISYTDNTNQLNENTEEGKAQRVEQQNYQYEPEQQDMEKENTIKTSAREQKIHMRLGSGGNIPVPLKGFSETTVKKHKEKPPLPPKPVRNKIRTSIFQRAKKEAEKKNKGLKKNKALKKKQKQFKEHFKPKTVHIWKGECLALWDDGEYYLAKIDENLGDGTYNVTYKEYSISKKVPETSLKTLPPSESKMQIDPPLSSSIESTISRQSNVILQDQDQNSPDVQEQTLEIRNEKRITFSTKKKLGLKYNGHEVTEINPNSQADNEGVKKGWQIISVNEKKIPKKTSAIKKVIKAAKKQRDIIDIVFSIPLSFEPGEKCKALWNDGKYYDAVIECATDQGYEITYPEYSLRTEVPSSSLKKINLKKVVEKKNITDGDAIESISWSEKKVPNSPPLPLSLPSPKSPPLPLSLPSPNSTMLLIQNLCSSPNASYRPVRKKIENQLGRQLNKSEKNMMSKLLKENSTPNTPRNFKKSRFEGENDSGSLGNSFMSDVGMGSWLDRETEMLSPSGDEFKFISYHDNATYEEGEECIAFWKEDSNYYDAIIKQCKGHGIYLITYPKFNETIEVSIESLRKKDQFPSITLGHLPHHMKKRDYEIRDDSISTNPNLLYGDEFSLSMPPSAYHSRHNSLSYISRPVMTQNVSPKHTGFAALGHCKHQVLSQVEKGMESLNRAVEVVKTIATSYLKCSKNVSNIAQKALMDLNRHNADGSTKDGMESWADAFDNLYCKVLEYSKAQEFQATELFEKILNPLQTFRDEQVKKHKEVIKKEKDVYKNLESIHKKRQTENSVCEKLIKQLQDIHQQEKDNVNLSSSPLTKSSALLRGNSRTKAVRYKEKAYRQCRHYQKTIKKTNQVESLYYGTQLPLVMKDLEKLEADRLYQMQQSMTNLVGIQKCYHEGTTLVLEEIDKKFSTVNPQRDIEAYVNKILTYRGHWDLPPPNEYDLSCFPEDIKNGRFYRSPNSVFGSSLSHIMKMQENHQKYSSCPVVFHKLMEGLEKSGSYDAEGVFRISVPSDDVKTLSDNIDNGNYPNEWPSAHHPAALLKAWLRLLSEPLIPSALYPDACILAQNKGMDSQDAYIHLFQKLDKVNQNILLLLTEMIIRIESNSEVTKMNMNNLAIVFAPGILRNDDSDSDMMCNFMDQIEFSNQLFKVLSSELGAGRLHVPK